MSWWRYLKSTLGKTIYADGNGAGTMEEDAHARENARNKDSLGGTRITIEGNNSSGGLLEKPLPDNNRRTKIERRITQKTRESEFRRSPLAVGRGRVILSDTAKLVTSGTKTGTASGPEFTSSRQKYPEN